MESTRTETVLRIARSQHGVVSRRQALEAGLSSTQIAHRVRSHRWQRIHPGVFAVHVGPLTWWARAWAAVLYAGQGAALSHRSAAFVWGLITTEPPVLKVVVPGHRTVVRPPGVRVSRRTNVEVVQRNRVAITSVAQTILDLAAEPGCTVDDVVALLGRAMQRNLLDIDAFSELLAGTARHPMRRVLRLACTDVAAGVQSALEARVVRGVIEPHGLTGFELQVPLSEVGSLVGSGGEPADLRTSDLAHRELGIRIEGDGYIWHQERFLEDRRKDRDAAAAGEITLRVAWADAVDRGCETAVQLACTMTRRGWMGVPTACGPTCTVVQRWALRMRAAR